MLGAVNNLARSCRWSVRLLERNTVRLFATSYAASRNTQGAEMIVARFRLAAVLAESALSAVCSPRRSRGVGVAAKPRFGVWVSLQKCQLVCCVRGRCVIAEPKSSSHRRVCFGSAPARTLWSSSTADNVRSYYYGSPPGRGWALASRLAVRVVSPTVQALQALAQPVLPSWGSVWLFWTLTDAVQQAAFASREMAVPAQQGMAVQVQ